MNGFVLEDRNPNRISPLHNNKSIGGKLNEDGYFSFDVYTLGESTVAYVQDLKRILVQLDTYQINDLAENVPTQTMDVLPAIQDDRVLLPVRFIANALSVHVGWIDETGEVTLGSEATP